MIQQRQLYSAKTYDSGHAETTSQRRDYTYDSAWNLTKTTNNTTVTTRTVNNLSQITAGGGTYTYDNNGNRTGIASGPTYAYDDDHNSRSERLLWGNKLVAGLGSHYQLTIFQENTSFASPADKTDFTYDGKGRLRRRIEYTWNTTFSTWLQVTDTRYIYAGMLCIQERNSSNNPEVSYTRGWDLSSSLEGAGGIGGLLARTHHLPLSTNHHFYHADGNGNITMMLDSSQASVATYKYDPYGNLFSSSGTLANANLYRFSSKLWCANAGLYYYGYRFYDPTLQRWLNRDPIQERGGINLYRALKNNPLRFVDALGLKIVVDPSASEEFKKMVENCMCILSQSPHGRKLLEDAENHKNTVLIQEDEEAYGDSLSLDQTPNGVVIIGLYPGSPNGVSPEQEEEARSYPGNQIPQRNDVGCAIVLGHELGHVVTGASDDPERGNNVVNNENVIRTELGVEERTYYRNIGVVP